MQSFLIDRHQRRPNRLRCAYVLFCESCLFFMPPVTSQTRSAVLKRLETLRLKCAATRASSFGFAQSVKDKDSTHTDSQTDTNVRLQCTALHVRAIRPLRCAHWKALTLRPSTRCCRHPPLARGHRSECQLRPQTSPAHPLLSASPQVSRLRPCAHPRPHSCHHTVTHALLPTSSAVRACAIIAAAAARSWPPPTACRRAAYPHQPAHHTTHTTHSA